MKSKDISQEYFEWMCSIVCQKRGQNHRLLLEELHDILFIPTEVMDQNREADGMELRYRFGQEQNIDQRVIASELDMDGCSVLEMMVALALRCEEQIMADSTEGDRTEYWFWQMVSSLNLMGMDDRHFDCEHVDDAIGIFQNREYNPDGSGGLFTIPGFPRDMRALDIWYQMLMYLDYIQ